MEERLEVEVQIGEQQPSNGRKPTAGAVAAIEGAQELALDALDTSRLSDEAQALISRCMDGSEPYGPEPWAHYHVKKFSPMHVNIAVLRAAGFRGKEIAEITGTTRQVVYYTLTHPFAKKLYAVLVPSNGARVIDIRTRVDEYAGELLDKVFGMALLSDDLEDVTKVSFGLLDRAGYGAKPVAPTSSERVGGAIAIVPESTMSKLLQALEGSAAINNEVMPTFVPRRPPEEVILGSASTEVGDQPLIAPGDGGAPSREDTSLQIPRAASGSG